MTITKKQIKILWGRAAGKCSFPDCNKDLVFEEKNKKYSIIGHNAHICSPKLDGPRYNPAISQKELNLYENLILLCSEHHKIIDDNLDLYTVAKLLEIKRNHEMKMSKGQIPKAKKIYSQIWKDSKSITPIDILGQERGSPKYSFKEFYYEREIDDLFNEKVLDSKNNILLVGRPLSGKSRLLYQLLKTTNEKTEVLIPKYIDFDLDNIVVPSHFNDKKRKIVILDDLHRYLQLKNFHYLFNLLISEENITIIATCQSEFRYDSTKNELLRKLHLNLESIFNIIKVDPIKVEEAKRIVKEIGKHWKEVNFDGTIGSIFLPIVEMKRRFSEECNDKERTILKSIKIANLAGIYEGKNSFNKNQIKKIALEFYNLVIKEYEYIESLERLNELELLTVENEQIRVEEIYIIKIITPDQINLKLTEIEILSQLFETDVEALILLGKELLFSYETNLLYIDYIQKGITILLAILDKIEDYLDKGMIYYYIGGIFGILAELFNQEENCIHSINYLSKSLEYIKKEKYPLTAISILNDLGIGYRNLAIVRSKSENALKAINCLEEAIQITKKHGSFFHPSTIYNNLALSYYELSKIDNPIQNLAKAIIVYEDGLKLSDKVLFPFEFATLQSNLSEAYCSLAEIENEKTNSEKAISAAISSLEIFTFEKNPIDYAYSNMSLGMAYRILATVENPIENCNKALSCFNESLRVMKRENMPLKYANVQLGIGNVYTILYLEERKKEFFKEAITSLENSLMIYKENKSLIFEAKVLMNIGNMFFEKARTIGEDIESNCRIAIQKYHESLSLRNKEIAPFDFATTQINLGLTYAHLSSVSSKKKNLKKAIIALNKAREIFSEKDAPLFYSRINYHLGMVHLLLSQEIHKKENCKLAFEFYKIAMKISKKHSIKLFDKITKELEMAEKICNQA
ncbi:MAG: tetratricopeptide repeat protein [Candidatus Heimdallarchaeota archaeon]|nr:tetratricopeptide repeat protein [Candidatus Heimdallarchaeota archaeon]